ncbi:PREDICTED: nudix hydrolase 9 [Nelumbo nucifera]|uniref:Nudix hydrolase 9 n=1 Tax=Nelumbo nucifera TaxID=4432 RepID=A0A1U7ZJP5_NELNU|nr:PREDICTED: nudix hydrolase 9 [Nelumbo nucifera]XP_010253364.1 PREDICTED: nudix hydrolase 9 [Nelumbo nucifera]XP_010253365.1 PREDICTED: nudix hydrolase 9 [Nelumbo nucifera]XP_010253366.1 PREDICTED: nudix hydrolase 9 [Nelumbo nucifera]XP_010253367.1 PREDICTED: nudix hydrolase 9 [Nelumbo nucifera]
MEKSEADVRTEVHPPSYMLLLTCPSGLSQAQLSVDFSSSYDRIPHPDIYLENTISEIWDRRLKENPSLYNGKKFRYGGYLLQSTTGSNHGPHVCLHLGLTDYRTFVGTNLNPLWEKFLVPSEDDSIRCQHCSTPLGNGAVVETADRRILVLQRSNNVGEFPGYFVFPGGHSEPEEIGIASHQYDKDLTDSGHINRKVSQEMFDGIIREVIEEIGVPTASLSDPVFIGISRRELNVRPTAFFFLKCNLQSEKIQQLYSSAQDGYESTQLYTVSRIELETMESKMPGCHRGGFALYKLMTEAVQI